LSATTAPGRFHVSESGSAPGGARLLALLPPDGSPLPLREHRRVHPRPPDPGRRPAGELIEIVETSGLRGRGGGSFPTGAKLRAVSERGRRPVVVVNGCEGEPASGKDALLLTRLPHLVLDGAALAAAAVGAREIVVCVKRGAENVAGRLDGALAERRSEGGPPLRVAQVPERYVAGEETALVHWLNGGPAKPTLVPPRPFESGVGGRPTLVQNVETLAHVAQIFAFGAEWFRCAGTAKEPGTMLLSVSGGVLAPGFFEVPWGIPLADVLDAAGTAGPLSAVLLGGCGGSWISSDAAASLRLTEGDLRPLGASVGCGAIVALPSKQCGLLETARVLEWLAAETAGQCGPCVHGLAALAGSVSALHDGRHTRRERDRLRRWASDISGRGACHHPDGALRLLRSALTVFADDIERHSRRRSCPGAGRPPALPLPRSVGGWR